MAPIISKYFIYTVFLVSPFSLSLFAQSTIENSIVSNEKYQASEDHIKLMTTATANNNLGNSKQFMVELSIPKGSFTIKAAGINSPNFTVIEKSKDNIVNYSALAKDIIENYKYDFSETFIDILFYEDIDLARIRTI